MKIKSFVYGAVLIFLSVIVYHTWFTFSLFQYSDWWFFFATKLRELSIPSVWLTNAFGSFDLTFWKLPVYFFYSIFGYLNFDSNVSDFFVVFLPIIFLLPLSSFFFIRKILLSDEGAFVGAVVFSFNTYFLSIATQGHEMITIASAFCVSSFLFLMKGLEAQNKSFRHFLMASLMLFASSFYDIRMSYIIMFVAALYLLYFLIFIGRPSGVRLFPLLGKISIAILCFIFFNFYWFFPQIESGSLLDNSILSRSLFGNNFWNLQSSISLFHPFWTGSMIRWFVEQPVPFYFWFVPILAFTGFLLNRKNKYVTFFGIISLIGIFLAKQVDEPFPSVYPWLYNSIPGFGAFREATKFYFLTILGYSVLLGSLTTWLLKNCNRSKAIIFLKYSLIVFVVGLFLWNAKPIISGEIGSMFTPRRIPDDYLILRDFIESQPEYFRTLWVPSNSRWSVNTDKHPELSLVNTVPSFWQNILSYNDFINWPKPGQIISSFNHQFSQDLLSISGVKYVIIPLSDTKNDDDFFQYYGGDDNPSIRQWYIKALNGVSWLKEIDVGTKDLVVYENRNYKQPITSFTTLYSLDSSNNLDANFNFINAKLAGQFYFTTPGTKNDVAPITNIFVPFENLRSIDISTAGKLSAVTHMSTDKETILYSLSKTNRNIRINDAPVLLDTKVFIPFSPGKNFITYQDPSYSFVNLISNGSFESGSWQEKVSDCNNYDNKALISMRLDTMEKSDGNQSLELSATRHNACDYTTIPVEALAQYLLSFDYQSYNALRWSYHLEFNDKAKTGFTVKLPIIDTAWHTFSRIIVVPDGATTLSLYVYALEEDGNIRSVNHYDNFKLINIPNISNAYYLVSQPKQRLWQPTSTTFEFINPTKRLVHIRGATTPFFLAMSESYHSNWQLELNDDKVHGFIGGFWPFTKPNVVPSTYHYELNDFLNAWYVDPLKLCRVSSIACTKNADGSYDMEILIEFTSQRWFYMGLLISGMTLLGCFIYIGYGRVRRGYIKKYD